jgi:hypothetical protein
MRHWRLPSASTRSNVGHIFQRVDVHVEIEGRSGGRVVSRGRVGVLTVGIAATLLMLLLGVQGWRGEWAEIGTGDGVLGNGLEGRVSRGYCW